MLSAWQHGSQSYGTNVDVLIPSAFCSCDFLFCLGFEQLRGDSLNLFHISSITLLLATCRYPTFLNSPYWAVIFWILT